MTPLSQLHGSERVGSGSWLCVAPSLSAPGMAAPPGADNFTAGMGSGTKSICKGVAVGVSALVAAPVVGFQKGGVMVRGGRWARI